MDTRQLAAFCAVVERKSFSQAAERLGVTQPAVSLQVRSLEKRLGRRLLDRSGRRVEPTEAGVALYRGAQRLLALEGQLLEELEAGEEGELGGTLEVGASTGPGSTVVPVLLGEFQRQNPSVAISLSISDTQSVVDRVADGELEVGAVGSARLPRGFVFEPLFRDEVVLACPPGHRFAGRTVTLDELREEPLIVMQEGAGVRQVIEDELRRAGTRLRDLEPKLELGLQESARSAGAAGYRGTVISPAPVQADLPAAGRWSEVPSDRIPEIAAQAQGWDGILAVGGGSAIDLAKAVSAVTKLPLVSVPTTYSGAEWTPFYGVRDPQKHMVGGGGGAHLAGTVYDPQLTLDLPRAESGGTALNALAHAAEALYVTRRNPTRGEPAPEGG